MPGSRTSRTLQPPHHLQPHLALPLHHPDPITTQITYIQLSTLTFENMMRVRLLLSLGIGALALVGEWEGEWLRRGRGVERAVGFDGDE
jgi:hypothetical protein